MNFFQKKQIKQIREIILIVGLLIAPIASLAEEVMGKTFPIIEEDLLNYLQERARAMQEDGTWEKMQKRWIKEVSSKMLRPRPVKNLTRAIKTKAWDFDPSIVLPNDLYASGKVFAKQGEKINPLSLVTIHKPMVFFDGDDPEQVKWVEGLKQKYSDNLKLVLVNGSVLEQENYFKLPIYFDQEGKLTTKFAIQHVPAFVIQKGLLLKITEVAL